MLVGCSFALKNQIKLCCTSAIPLSLQIHYRFILDFSCLNYRIISGVSDLLFHSPKTLEPSIQMGIYIYLYIYIYIYVVSRCINIVSFHLYYFLGFTDREINRAQLLQLLACIHFFMNFSSLFHKKQLRIWEKNY